MRTSKSIMWPFRRSQTPVDGHERHTVVLDLIEQVAYMRGQITALEHDWKSTKEQVRKDYQRVEKANQRAERREFVDEGEAGDVVPKSPEVEPSLPLTGFARKLEQMKGA